MADKKDKTKIALRDTDSKLVGSDDPDFMNVLLTDVLNSMWLPEGTSEETKSIKINAAIEMLRQIAPRDGIEGMLAVQMTSTHQAAMECFRRAAIPDQTFQARNVALKHAEKLLRLYMDQVKALNKQRGRGDQKMVIEHVNIAAGGQAIVGQVENSPKGKTEK